MVLNLSNSEPGKSRRLRVGVLLFDDVEVLDFAGPLEVFGVTITAAGDPAFEVATVALQPGNVLASNNLIVVPNGVAEDLSQPDILVIPGGRGTRKELSNPAMLGFLRGTVPQSEVTLSVCTGALLLGAAGLLKGLSATTHWAAMEELRALNAASEILPDCRIVDNGRVVTSAGVSAGIDAALYVVSRLLGPACAQRTADHMQYDWRHRGPGVDVAVRTSA